MRNATLALIMLCVSLHVLPSCKGSRVELNDADSRQVESVNLDVDEQRSKLINEYLHGDSSAKIFARAELCFMRPKIQDYLIENLNHADKEISNLCMEIMTYDNLKSNFLFDQEVSDFEVINESLDRAIERLIQSTNKMDSENRGVSYFVVRDVIDKNPKISIEKQSHSFVKLLNLIICNTDMRFSIHHDILEIYSMKMPREENVNEKLFLEVKEKIKNLISTQDVLAADREPVKWIVENRDKIQDYLYMYKNSGIPRLESIISKGQIGCNMSSRLPKIKFEDEKLDDILQDLANKIRVMDPDKKVFEWNIEGDRKSFIEPLVSCELDDISIDEFMDIICRANMATWRAEGLLIVTRKPIAEEIIKSQKIKIESFEKELLQAAHGDIKRRHEFKKSGWQIYLIKKYIDDPDPAIKALCKDIIDEWNQDQEAP